MATLLELLDQMVKKDGSDLVQLCAQALCLEEINAYMLAMHASSN